MTLLLHLAAVATAGTVSLSPGDDIIAKTQGLGAGDEIIFTAGTYDITSTIVWEGLGTATEPIVFKTIEDAEVVIRLTGYGSVAEVRNSTFLTVQGITFEGGEGWEGMGNTGLRIVDSTDITVQDVEVRNVQYNALDIDGNGANFQLLRNDLHHTLEGSGIAAGCWDASCWLQDSVIAENHLHDLGGEYNYGIWLGNGGQNVEIRDNVIYRVGTGEGGDGIYTGSTEFGAPNWIVGNVIWQVTADGIWVEGASRVQNNVVFDVGEVGIGSSNNDRDGLTDVVISFNTVVGTGDDGVELHDWLDRDAMVFANNVVSNPIGYGFDYDSYWTEGATTTNFISHNFVTGLVEGYDTTLYPDWVMPGGGYSDFVDAENWNFYPASGAVIVNGGDPAGEAWVPELDFNGAPRQGDAPDAGAYEWDGTDNPGWTVQEGFKELGYTSFDNAGDVGGGCCGANNTEQEPTEALLLLPLGLGVLARRRSDRRPGTLRLRRFPGLWR